MILKAKLMLVNSLCDYGLLNPNSNPLVLDVAEIQKAVQKINNTEAVDCNQQNVFHLH